MSTTSTSERLYSVAVAADRLNMSRYAVYRLIASGDLEALELPLRGGTRITDSALAKFQQRLKKARRT